MREMVLFCYLTIGAIMDGRKKMLSVSYLWVGGILALGFLWKEFVIDKMEGEEFILRLIPGVFFLLYARVTKQKIGYGDGILMLILGICLPADLLWKGWIMAVFFIFLWAVLLLVMKKGGKNTRIPFIPFLWFANGILWGMNHG